MGPVEAVYWIKDIRVQWRIRGKCWFLAADDIEGGRSCTELGYRVSEGSNRAVYEGRKASMTVCIKIGAGS